MKAILAVVSGDFAFSLKCEICRKGEYFWNGRRVTQEEDFISEGGVVNSVMAGEMNFSSPINDLGLSEGESCETTAAMGSQLEGSIDL